MKEVTEKFAAERVIAHVLDDGACIGIGMSFRQLVRRALWEALQQEWLNAGVPCAVDNRLMCEDGIRAGCGGERREESEADQSAVHAHTVEQSVCREGDKLC